MGLRERFSQSTLGSPERFALEFESALAEAYSKLAKHPGTDPEFMP